MPILFLQQNFFKFPKVGARLIQGEARCNGNGRSSHLH
jgi:hypothetical protein